MRLFSTVAAAALMSMLPLSAHATDLLNATVPASNGVPAADAGFDWNRFYAGLYGVAQSSAAGGLQYGVGVDAGIDARLEFVVVGGEVAYHGLIGGAGATSYLQGIGKAGLAITDDVVVYGAGGLGVDLGPPTESDALLGAGVEMAVANDVSLDAQYLHGFPLAGANPKDQLKVGANFHF